MKFTKHFYIEGQRIVSKLGPDGMLDDGYTIDDNGNINRVDNTGGEKYDVLYSKKEYEAAKESGKTNADGNPAPENNVKVDDTSILPQLENNTNTFEFNSLGCDYTANVANASNRKDVYNLFKFASENSNVEWNYQRYTDGTLSLTTANSNSTVIGGSGHSSNSGKVIAADIHSHPGTTRDDLRASGQDFYVARDVLYQRNKNVKVQLYMPKHPNPMTRWLDLINNEWINY